MQDEAFVKRFAPNGMRAPARSTVKDVTACMTEQVERNGEFAKMQSK